jgi:uncharacterized membrane-anchored protein YhcB (DUF1043 family)
VSPNTVTALALIAGTVGAVVMVWRARRESQRLEDQVEDMRRQVDDARRELEEERERERWRDE